MKKYLTTGVFCLFIVLLFGLIIPVTRDFICVFIPYIPILLWVLFIINRGKQKPKKMGMKILYFSIVVVASFLMSDYWKTHSEKLIYLVYPFENGYRWYMKYAVPLLSGINWAMVVYCTASICYPIKNKIFQIMAASFLMVIYDILLEQNSEFLCLWKWNGNLLPNYQFWFISAVTFHILRSVMKVEVKNKVADYAYWGIIVLFVGLLMLRPVI